MVQLERSPGLFVAFQQLEEPTGNVERELGQGWTDRTRGVAGDRDGWDSRAPRSFLGYLEPDRKGLQNEKV